MEAVVYNNIKAEAEHYKPGMAALGFTLDDITFTKGDSKVDYPSEGNNWVWGFEGKGYYILSQLIGAHNG